MVLKFEIKKNDPKTLILLWEGEVWKEVSKSLFLNDLRKLSEDITWTDFVAHFTLLEQKIAKRYVIYLLSKRNFLSSDLESKLLRKGVSPAVVKATISHCSEKGYLNDSREVERLYAKELAKGRSSKGAYFKLKQKKVVNEEQLRQLLAQTGSADQIAIKKWLAKTVNKINRDDPNQVKKLMAKLYRRGFSSELILSELKCGEWEES